MAIIMKYSWLIYLPTVSAFTVQRTAPPRQRNLALQAVTRRDLFTSTAVATTGSLVGLITPANADVDYSKIQDLLGRPGDDDSSAASRTYTASGARPTYLTEPTEDFKKNEVKASEFRRKQIQQKEAFMKKLDKLDTDPNDQDLLARDLDDIRASVRSNGGLPLGITKEELVKRVRRRKAKRYWPVQVEIAYQDLLQELRQQQSPNLKDEENPL